jgi:competence protein ComEA
MINQLLFWLKTHLGFTKKESQGFFLLLPTLLILSLLPKVMRYFSDQRGEDMYRRYLSQLDSLERAGGHLLASPLPTFAPMDSVKRKGDALVKGRIRRLPLSEADSILLQIVPGIGALTAGRIIKYRESLGGFIFPEQLQEVFGLRPEVISSLWEYFDFDKVPPKKICINQVNQEVLAQHPYISYQEAKVLVAYRMQHGPYERAQDLLKIKIFQEAWVEKIGPYLCFEKE